MTSARGTAAWVSAGVGLLGVAAVLRGGGVAGAPGELGSASASPGVRFVSVALGGFRGLLADVLWVRASELQDEGRFYELVQLADWITRLEPRHADVWAFHAWNLAYNISVMFPDPRDRWRWVSHGVRLLRDEGIPANPRDDQLHWELGWLYADKIGGCLDESQAYYRLSMALDMSRLLPDGRADDAALATPQAAAALEAAKLRPAVMQAIDRTYGPFDWRLPEPHAIYWGYTGREAGRSRSPWCARLVYQGMFESIRSGRLLLDPRRSLYVRGPRLDIAARAAAVVEADPDAQAHEVSMPPVENLMREAMLMLYAFGHEDQALAPYRILQRLPGVEPAPSLEAAVRRECREREDGHSARSQERTVTQLLTQSHLWSILGDPALARGYASLARLYWEAILDVPGPGATFRSAGAWERIDAQALRMAGDQVPGGAPAGQG